MGKHKLVPVEPTEKMLNAGLDLGSVEVSEVVWIYEAMLAAAPTVQGEPVGRHTEDHLDDKSATTYSAEVAQRWRDKGWPVRSPYTAPQPAPEVVKLMEALEEISDPIRFMQERLEEGGQLNGMAAAQLAEDASYLRGIANAALAAYRKQGGD